MTIHHIYFSLNQLLDLMQKSKLKHWLYRQALSKIYEHQQRFNNGFQILNFFKLQLHLQRQHIYFLMVNQRQYTQQQQQYKLLQNKHQLFQLCILRKLQAMQLNLFQQKFCFCLHHNQLPVLKQLLLYLMQILHSQNQHKLRLMTIIYLLFQINVQKL